MKGRCYRAIAMCAVLAGIATAACPSRSPQGTDPPQSHPSTGGEKRSASTRKAPSGAPVTASEQPPALVDATADASARSVAAAPDWPPPPPQQSSKWCSGPVHVLDERTCYALPPERTRTLLVYFHGLVPPSLQSAQKDNLFEVVARASVRARAAVLLPLGLAELAPEKKFAGWYGWPTRGETYAEHTVSLVKQVHDARARLEALTGTEFERLYLAGSSSGAYFVSGLALRGDLLADGYAALSGGSAQLAPSTAAAEQRPFYVGYGSFDGARSSAMQLVNELKRRGWPVAAAEHRTGHGAREVYLDEAFAHWERALE